MVYIGGDFSNVSSTPRSYLAADGTDGVLTSWSANGNEDPYDYVQAISVSNNTIYAGGKFNGIGLRPIWIFRHLSPDARLVLMRILKSVML